MDMGYWERRYWYEGHNNIPKAEVTVAQKLNQTSSPKTRCISFSGVLFWFFFAQAKKNINR
jgi:hypothetical protein